MQIEDNLDEFEANLEYMIAEMPKETYTVLRGTGSKARTIIARKARSLVGKKTGNYYKGFKRGKPYQAEDGSYRIRVFNNMPHAHLIEDGHRIIGKDGSEHGFKPGYKVMQKAEKEVEAVWNDLLEEQINKVIDKM